MRKAFLAVVVALCLVMLLGATAAAAPRVGLKSFAMDLGVAGINPHGDPDVWWMGIGGVGVGGFVDLSLALPGGLVLRGTYQRTFGVYGGIALGEAVLQYDVNPYGALYAGALVFGTHPVSAPSDVRVFPQAGLVLRLPLADNLSLYGLLSAQYDSVAKSLFPGYGAYLTLDFGHGFGVCAGARGFGSTLTKSPWITTGLSYTF